MQEEIVNFDYDDATWKLLKIHNLCEFSTNDLSHFRESIRNDIDEKNKNNNKRLIELKGKLEGVYISDDNVDLYAEKWMLKENLEKNLASLKILEELSILSLQKHIEITLTNLLITKYHYELIITSESEKDNNKRIQAKTKLSRKKRSLHKFENIKNILNENDIDMTSIKYFEEYNELRNLGNAIKHSGKVTKDLSDFSDWNIDEEISYDKLKKAHDKLSIIMVKFIKEVCLKINSNKV